MPITEATKIEVASRRQVLRQRIKKNVADIQLHQATIARLRDQNTALKATADALKADIPDPTPVPDPI